jgi:HEPN domain-containing protein
VDRTDFQRLARIRIKEAKALLDRGLYDGAYYLAGFAVECALKACIARQRKKYEFPDKSLTEQSYTHHLGRLLKAAKLEDEWNNKMETDSEFRLRWESVDEWTVESRYQSTSRSNARALYFAVVSRRHGVLRWLRTYW